jgi:predicted MFS family arabinose efflux permease
MNPKLRKYLTIVALGITGGSIYFLPYIKYVFYDAQVAAMGISNAQTGILLTMYTVGNMILYIPGGILADKLQPKKVLITSLLGTAALCFVYAFTFNYAIALVIWTLLSFTTAFVFWSSLMKAVRMIGTEEEQGFMYGLYYACNGISGAITQSIALTAYKTGGEDIVTGFFRAVIAGGVVAIVAAILLTFLMDSKSASEESDDNKFRMKDVGTLLKSPIVWIFSFIVFCGDGIFANTSFFTPYLTDVMGMSAASSGAVTILRNYVFLLLAPVGGLIADKLFKSTAKWLSVGFLILAALFAGVLILPDGISTTAASIYTLIPGAFAMMTYGVVFSTISESGIPRMMTGTAIGLASIIGYMPDSVYATLFGHWLDKFGTAGYTRIFVFLAVSGVVGSILSIIVYTTNKRKNKASQVKVS